MESEGSRSQWSDCKREPRGTAKGGIWKTNRITAIVMSSSRFAASGPLFQPPPPYYICIDIYTRTAENVLFLRLDRGILKKERTEIEELRALHFEYKITQNKYLPFLKKGVFYLSSGSFNLF